MSVSHQEELVKNTIYKLTQNTQQELTADEISILQIISQEEFQQFVDKHSNEENGNNYMFHILKKFTHIVNIEGREFQVDQYCMIDICVNDRYLDTTQIKKYISSKNIYTDIQKYRQSLDKQYGTFSGLFNINTAGIRNKNTKFALTLRPRILHIRETSKEDTKTHKEIIIKYNAQNNDQEVQLSHSIVQQIEQQASDTTLRKEQKNNENTKTLSIELPDVNLQENNLLSIINYEYNVNYN